MTPVILAIYHMSVAVHNLMELEKRVNLVKLEVSGTVQVHARLSSHITLCSDHSQ